MKRAALLAFAATACAHVPAPPESALSLARAEASFAAHSVREDMRAAFLAHFAPTGVFVRDGWTVARDFLAPRPAPPIVLDWRPAFVEVASSGELGLSTGPWRLRPRDAPSASEAFGQFVSVWRREDEGPWRVVVDLGVSHPGPELWDAPLLARRVAAAADGATLGQAEDAFREAFAHRGPGAAYGELGAADLRHYREGRAPAVSLATIEARAFEPREARWSTDELQVARSGDLGFVRGAVALPGAPRPLGYFLRVWRREAGGWRIALDVVQPAPRG